MKTHFSFSWSELSTSISIDIDANEKKMKTHLSFHPKASEHSLIRDLRRTKASENLFYRNIAQASNS